MRLLIDMNLSPRWRAPLQSAGYDAVHWSEVGEPEATDGEIMSYALAHGYTVLTHVLVSGPSWPQRRDGGRAWFNYGPTTRVPKRVGRFLSRGSGNASLTLRPEHC